MRDIPRIVEASLQKSRDDMAANCAKQGVVMPKDADFGALATCGRNRTLMVRTSLLRARGAIASTPDLSDAQRQRALAGLDQALSEIDAR